MKFTDWDVMNNITMFLCKGAKQPITTEALIVKAYSEDGLQRPVMKNGKQEPTPFTPIASIFYQEPTELDGMVITNLKKNKRPLLVITQQMLSASQINIGINALYDTVLETSVRIDIAPTDELTPVRPLIFASNLLAQCRKFNWKSTPKDTDGKEHKCLPIAFDSSEGGAPIDQQGYNQRGFVRYTTTLRVRFNYQIRR